MGSGKSNFKSDMKKILPLWGGLLTLIIVGVVVIKLTNLRIINYLEYPEMKISHIAKSYFLEGEKHWLKCSGKIERLNAAGKKPVLETSDTDYIKARELFLKSLSYSGMPDTYNYLADLALFVNNMPENEYYQGKFSLLNQPNGESALKSFKKAIELKPDYLPAIQETAELYLKNKDIPNAENYINMYEKFAAESGMLYHLQALKKFSENKIDEAIALLEKSIQKKSDKQLNSYLLISDCYSIKGDSQKECAAVEKAVELAPMHPTYLHKLGICYLKLNQPDKARDVLKKALENIPNHSQLNLDLAKAYHKLGKTHFAAFYLNKAIELDPKIQKEMLEK